MSDWQPIETAPKHPRRAGHSYGPLVYLLIPYSPKFFGPDECWDVGYWSIGEGCFRFTGDDGPDDIQPTNWHPLPSPPPGEA